MSLLLTPPPVTSFAGRIAVARDGVRVLVLAGAIGLAMHGTASAQTQRACPHAEFDRERIEATLRAASSCRVAYDLMNACRSNTSGDVDLAEIVIARCEADFVGTLTERTRATYEREREACRQRYAGKRGTMYASFAATCEAGVAAAHADRARGRSRSK